MSHEKPNILLIISDDHGYGDLSFRGVNPDVHTPNLDRLAASGTVFNQAFVSAPICSPSRAGLITGAYQQRWGAHWFDTSAFAPADFQSMPQALKQQGYRTGYFGKIHYGGDDNYGSRGCPDQHGFDESFYGLAHLSMGRLHYMRHSAAAVDEYGEAAKVHGVYPMLENGHPVDCETHLTEEFTKRALEFIDGTPKHTADNNEGVRGAGETPQDEPFFCMLAYNAVHNFAWQLPDYELDERGLPKHPDFHDDLNNYLDWYDGAIWPNLDRGREYYLAQLEIMDQQIGRVLDHLEATGQRDNTIVVYLTDNGGSTCNYGNNGDLKGTKYTLFEGGVRVPLIISAPMLAEPGQTIDHLVSSLDLLPTFVAAAGGEVTDDRVDGKNLLPLLQGGAPVHQVLHFDTGFQWSVRTPEWKLRWADGDSSGRKYLVDVEHTDIGSGLSLVPAGVSMSEEDDANVAEQNPEVVAELKALRERWLEQVHG